MSKAAGLWCRACRRRVFSNAGDWGLKYGVKQGQVFCMECYHLEYGVRDGAPVRVRLHRWWSKCYRERTRPSWKGLRMALFG